MRKVASCLIICMLIFLFATCEKSEKNTGQLTISYQLNEVKSLLKFSYDSAISYVAISVTSSSGKAIYSFEILELYNFNDSYITKAISLAEGSYKLTQFLVLNSKKEVIYAAPCENSEKAKLVNNPLPIFFNIDKDKVTGVTPEVVKVDALSTPNDFGYLTLSFTIINPDTSINRGLIAYFPFNGNANDESGFGNHGIVHGATLTTDRYGNPNSAYSFNGTSDYITTKDNPTLKYSDNITLSAWFKTNDPDIAKTDLSVGMIVSRNYTVKLRSFHLCLTNNNVYGQVAAFYLFDTNDNYTDFRNTNASNFYNDNWHHIVAVYHNVTGMSQIYIDGELKNQVSVGKINLEQTTIPLNIGAYSSFRGFFHGIIDEVRIYNRDLTTNEIAALALQCLKQ